MVVLNNKGRIWGNFRGNYGAIGGKWYVGQGAICLYIGIALPLTMP